MAKRHGNALVPPSEHLSPSVSEHVLRAPHLKRLIDGYLVTLASEGKSRNTISYRRWLLNKFLWWCEQGNAPIVVERITTSHIRQFFIYVQREPIRWGGKSTSSRRPASQMTLQHYYKSLHVFFGWLTSEGLIASNPTDGIKKPKAEQKVVQAFGQEEVKRLLASCDTKSFLGIRNKAILMLFLDTGLRLSELASLGVSDIDFERGTVLVRKGKGRKQRILHLGNRCQRAMWKWLMLRDSESDALFASEDGQPLTERGISIWFKRLSEKAHVTGGHGVHRLRHTFAIEFLRAGGDVMSLQYLLGHSSLEMVKRYLGSLTADDAARAHKRFSPMDRMELRGRS